MKVKWGSIIVAGSGTLGGHVYSRNHYGAFARTKVNPANPQTTYQQDIRNFFEQIQTAWSTLTSTQQAAWSAASVDYPKTDSFGSVYFLSGYNLFISLNLPYLRFIGSILTDPPTKAIPITSCAGTFTLNYEAGEMIFEFDTSPPEDDIVIQLFATRPLSAGVTYISTELRLIIPNVLPLGNPFNFSTEWTEKFITPPLSGQKIFIKLIPLRATTGDYGIPYFFEQVEP